jgi:hypothetical protein
LRSAWHGREEAHRKLLVPLNAIEQCLQERLNTKLPGPA